MVNELSVQSRLRPLKAPQKKTSDPVTFTNSNAKMQYNQGAVEKKKNCYNLRHRPHSHKNKSPSTSKGGGKCT